MIRIVIDIEANTPDRIDVRSEIISSGSIPTRDEIKEAVGFVSLMALLNTGQMKITKRQDAQLVAYIHKRYGKDFIEALYRVFQRRN